MSEAPLAERLSSLYRSETGVVHRAYLCEGPVSHPRSDHGPHLFCTNRTPKGEVVVSDAVTCRNCLHDNTWTAFVQMVEHLELYRLDHPAAEWAELWEGKG